MVKNKKIENIIGIILTVLALGILVYNCHFAFSSDIWFDELFTVELASKRLPELIRLASKDVHPPLYYIYVRGVYLALGLIDGGVSVVTAAKLASIIPYLLIFIYAVLFIRKNFGWISTGLTLIFIELMPQMSQYMVEARMYSVSMFVLLAMFIHGMEAVKGVPFVFDRNSEISYEDACSHLWCFWMKDHPLIEGSRKMYLHLAAAMLYAICAMYMHYYAFIGAAAIALCMMAYLLIRYYGDRAFIRKWKKDESIGNQCIMYVRPEITAVIAVIVICLVSYVPWEGAVLSQIGAVSSNYWIQPVSLKTFPGCIKFIFKPEFESAAANVAAAVIIFAAMAGMFVWYVLRGARAEDSEKDTVDSLQPKVSSADPNPDYRYQAGWHRFFACSCVSVTVILILTGYILSKLIRPIFVYRYMLPVMGIFWMGMAVCMGQFAARCIRGKKALLAGLICFCILTGAVLLRDFRMFMWEEQKKEAGMTAAEEVFKELAAEYPDTTVVCNFNQVQALLWYYLENDSILWGETDETLIADICGRSPIVMTENTDELMSLISADEHGGFIFVGSGNAREDILADWETEGLHAEELFDSCLIERYYVNIYYVN